MNQTCCWSWSMPTYFCFGWVFLSKAKANNNNWTRDLGGQGKYTVFWCPIEVISGGLLKAYSSSARGFCDYSRCMWWRFPRELLEWVAAAIRDSLSSNTLSNSSWNTISLSSWWLLKFLVQLGSCEKFLARLLRLSGSRSSSSCDDSDSFSEIFETERGRGGAGGGRRLLDSCKGDRYLIVYACFLIETHLLHQDSYFPYLFQRFSCSPSSRGRVQVLPRDSRTLEGPYPFYSLDACLVDSHIRREVAPVDTREDYEKARLLNRRTHWGVSGLTSTWHQSPKAWASPRRTLKARGRRTQHESCWGKELAAHTPMPVRRSLDTDSSHSDLHTLRF